MIGIHKCVISSICVLQFLFIIFFMSDLMTFHSECQLSVRLWRHPFSTCIWISISQLIHYARACRNYADFLYRAILLQLGFLNRVMLLQDWSHHYRSFIVVTMNSLIVNVFPSVPWKLICSTCQFSFLFRLSRTWLFMSNSACVSRKKQRALILPVHLVHAPNL